MISWVLNYDLLLHSFFFYFERKKKAKFVKLMGKRINETQHVKSLKGHQKVSHGLYKLKKSPPRITPLAEFFNACKKKKKSKIHSHFHLFFYPLGFWRSSSRFCSIVAHGETKSWTSFTFRLWVFLSFQLQISFESVQVYFALQIALFFFFFFSFQERQLWESQSSTSFKKVRVVFLTFFPILGFGIRGVKKSVNVFFLFRHNLEVLRLETVEAQVECSKKKKKDGRLLHLIIILIYLCSSAGPASRRGLSPPPPQSKGASSPSR